MAESLRSSACYIPGRTLHMFYLRHSSWMALVLLALVCSSQAFTTTPLGLTPTAPACHRWSPAAGTLQSRNDMQWSTTTTLQSAPTSTTSSSGVSGRRLIFQGMEAFRTGQVQESIRLFDEAAVVQPSLEPFLWQRGISLYYANDFDGASGQFRTDVRVNPSDVEEIVWDIASQLHKGSNKQFPLKTAMALPAGKTDTRRIMGPVYRLFRGEGSEQELALAGHTSQSPADAFYALFYLGLFAEAVGETTKAAGYMKRAVLTSYAKTDGRGDYMTSVARIHCQLRNWV